MSVKILRGDCRDILRTLPAESVHCVVTSPPYWGLRDYGVAGQIGLEETPEDFTARMVEVFRLVRRALRPDGTCWLNLGDTYGGMRGNYVDAPDNKHPNCVGQAPGRAKGETLRKQLIGIPWRVAFALQADGWYLRQDIIWSKPNPMPESVTDRCTKAHEYLFLLSKSERYAFDQDAILEPASPNTHARLAQDVQSQIGSERAHTGGKTNGNMKAVGRDVGLGANARPRKAVPNGAGMIKNNESFDQAMAIMPMMRNKRSVWEISTQPFSEAHFATFPPALIEPCVLAGCPAGGTVLDPFGGAGTTGLVADRLGRNAVLIELNPEYAAMAERRIKADAGMFASVE